MYAGNREISVPIEYILIYNSVIGIFKGEVGTYDTMENGGRVPSSKAFADSKENLPYKTSGVVGFVVGCPVYAPAAPLSWRS